MEHFYVWKSLGLWWVREGDINPALHGPFMDYRDAIEQSGADNGIIIYEGPR